VTLHSSLGIFFIRVSSTCLVLSFQRQNASRLATRSTCVSTAIAGISKATDKTTFAVFLPTPASDSSSALVFGTSPLKSSINLRASFEYFLLLSDTIQLI